MRYAINGRFLTQKLTGVQRAEREIVRALDKIVEPDEFCIVVPRDHDKRYCLKNIEKIEVGNSRGILWEQTAFYGYLKKNGLTGINLGNVAPLLKPDVVCIHDVKLCIHPEWFDWKYVIWSKLHYRNALYRGKCVLTVSSFSKKEIHRLYPDHKTPVEVVDLGWQHMDSIREDTHTLEKYGLEVNAYYFSVYQSMPNKNFNWILNAAKWNPGELFVVSGWRNKKNISSERDCVEGTDNVKVLGYISDEEMKCLMMNCRAFIFPSLYEGFGLPPLEAMAVGAKAVVMDIPVMREVFGDSVQYIEDGEYDIPVKEFGGNNTALARHSWGNGAMRLVEALKTYGEGK